MQSVQYCSVLLQVTTLQCGLFCSLLAVGVLAILSRGLIDDQLQASTLARYKPVLSRDYLVM